MNFLDPLLNLWQDRGFLRQIAEQNPFLGALLYVIFQALQIVVAPLPGEAGFIAGFLFGAKLGFFLHLLGTALGSTMAFSLARLFRQKFEKKIKNNSFAIKLKNFLKKAGIFGLFLAYLIPGFPKDVLNYLLGLLNISYRAFIFANLLGRAPTSFLMALQGDTLYQGKTEKFLLMGIVMLLCFLLLLALRKKIEKKLFENSTT